MAQRPNYRPDSMYSYLPSEIRQSGLTCQSRTRLYDTPIPEIFACGHSRLQHDQDYIDSAFHSSIFVHEPTAADVHLSMAPRVELHTRTACPEYECRVNLGAGAVDAGLDPAYGEDEMSRADEYTQASEYSFNVLQDAVDRIRAVSNPVLKTLVAAHIPEVEALIGSDNVVQDVYEPFLISVDLGDDRDIEALPSLCALLTDITTHGAPRTEFHEVASEAVDLINALQMTAGNMAELAAKLEEVQRQHERLTFSFLEQALAAVFGKASEKKEKERVMLPRLQTLGIASDGSPPPTPQQIWHGHMEVADYTPQEPPTRPAAPVQVDAPRTSEDGGIVLPLSLPLSASVTERRPYVTTPPWRRTATTPPWRRDATTSSWTRIMNWMEQAQSPAAMESCYEGGDMDSAFMEADLTVPMSALHSGYEGDDDTVSTASLEEEVERFYEELEGMGRGGRRV